MKKIIFIIASLFLINVYPQASLAADFDLADDEIDEDLENIFMNDGADFELFDTEGGEANGSMYMQGQNLDGDLFQLSILSKDMTTPTLGVAFHLIYEKDKLAFLRYEPGDFLEKGGDPFYLVKNDVSGDKIIFGETLRRNDDFPLGEGVITNFYFQILDGDQFNFEFKNGVISTLDTVRQDIDQIAWENFSFDKNSLNLENSDLGKNSVLSLNNSDGFDFWIVAIIIAVSIPFAYAIIWLIKKYSTIKKFPQIY